MKTLEVKVAEEESNEIERCQYEVNTRQNVIDRYLEKHMNDDDGTAIESKPFQYFMSQLASAEAELEIAKDALTKKYVPDVLNDHKVEWSLDFSTQVMTITVLCDCEIEGL